MSFTVEVVTPETLILKESVESATLPAVLGETTILTGHTHIIFDMVPGRMLVKTLDKDGNEQVKHYTVGRGFAEVSRQGNLTVFTKEVTP